MRILVVSLISLLCGCSSVGPASTSGYSWSRPSSTASTVGVEVVFTGDEIKIIRAYYAAHGHSGNGKWKRKNKGLPPGIAKNLQRGKPLPPGIAKRSLPYDLRLELPDPPKGYERIIVAGKILLVELGTQIVRDILTDAAFG